MPHCFMPGKWAKHVDMRADNHDAILQELESLSDWWLSAGVDIAPDDAINEWLIQKTETSQPPYEARANYHESKPPAAFVTHPKEPNSAQAPTFDPAEYNSLEALAHAFANDPRLVPFGGLGDRVSLPQVHEPELMILVEMPAFAPGAPIMSPVDERIWLDLLKSCQISPENAYAVPILSQHVPAADLRTGEVTLFVKLAARHVTLATPKKLAIVGGGGASALEGNISTKTAGDLPQFNHEGFSIPCIAMPSFTTQASRPELKRRSWERFLELLGRGNR